MNLRIIILITVIFFSFNCASSITKRPLEYKKVNNVALAEVKFGFPGLMSYNKFDDKTEKEKEEKLAFEKALYHEINQIFQESVKPDFNPFSSEKVISDAIYKANTILPSEKDNIYLASGFRALDGNFFEIKNEKFAPEKLSKIANSINVDGIFTIWFSFDKTFEATVVRTLIYLHYKDGLELAGFHHWNKRKFLTLRFSESCSDGVDENISEETKKLSKDHQLFIKMARKSVYCATNPFLTEKKKLNKEK